MKRIEKKWKEMKRNEKKWNEMKWNEMKRNEKKRNEKNWKELKRIEKNWKELKRIEKNWKELNERNERMKEMNQRNNIQVMSSTTWVPNSALSRIGKPQALASTAISASGIRSTSPSFNSTNTPRSTWPLCAHNNTRDSQRNEKRAHCAGCKHPHKHQPPRANRKKQKAAKAELRTCLQQAPAWRWLRGPTRRRCCRQTRTRAETGAAVWRGTSNPVRQRQHRATPHTRYDAPTHTHLKRSLSAAYHLRRDGEHARRVGRQPVAKRGAVFRHRQLERRRAPAADHADRRRARNRRPVGVVHLRALHHAVDAVAHRHQLVRRDVVRVLGGHRVRGGGWGGGEGGIGRRRKGVMGGNGKGREE